MIQTDRTHAGLVKLVEFGFGDCFFWEFMPIFSPTGGHHSPIFWKRDLLATQKYTQARKEKHIPIYIYIYVQVFFVLYACGII